MQCSTKSSQQPNANERKQMYKAGPSGVDVPVFGIFYCYRGHFEYRDDNNRSEFRFLERALAYFPSSANTLCICCAKHACAL